MIIIVDADPVSGPSLARLLRYNGHAAEVIPSAMEALALLHALREHCDCHVSQGRTVAACAGHLMLARDQRAVDGLLFMRRMADR